jgi:hypothetical protein
VNLGQLGDGCGNTRRLLTEKYGPPSEPERRLAIWRDEASNNIINWSDNNVLHALSPDKEPACYVSYKPLKGASPDL